MNDCAAPGLVDALDALLPQTQCRRCGFDGCRPYAEAVATGTALNRCPPGGDAVIAELAAHTGRPPTPLDRSRGDPAPLQRAAIDESACIGCTLCIDACPVDAIVGAARRLHAVLPAWCTGCELCVAPCPVDCIRMLPAGRAWSHEDARAARARFDARRQRPMPRHRDRSVDDARSRRQQAVAAALARARARRAVASSR